MYTPKEIPNTVDREIFTIHVLNFCVKNIFRCSTVLQRSAYTYFNFSIFVVPFTDENILTAKNFRFTVSETIDYESSALSICQTTINTYCL